MCFISPAKKEISGVLSPASDERRRNFSGASGSNSSSVHCNRRLFPSVIRSRSLSPSIPYQAEFYSIAVGFLQHPSPECCL
ncbi:unnamed protein product [Victoria cruziana]